MLTEEGLAGLVEVTGLSRLVPKVRRVSDSAGMSPEQHVRRALERLGVTFIKGGQALSTRTDLIPPALAAELGKLQDEVAAEPFETMRAVIEAELEMPIDEAFAAIDPEPLGAASIGQVYRATLPGGTPVAVKVQRPGVVQRAEVDLDIAMTLVRFAQGRVPESAGFDLVGLANEFADALRSEFDYVREATNAEKLRRAFRGDGAAVFPRVFWTHTTPRVLTLELLEGVRMNRPAELDAAGYDRSALALNGINAYLGMIFEVGMFHADPHPGNFIAMPGNRVGFTDFGRVGVLSNESRERFVELLRAILDRDAEAAAETFLDLASSSEVDEEALQRDCARLIDKYHGRLLGSIDITDLVSELLTLFRRHHLGIPNDFAMMLATLAVLEGVGTMLDPGFDFTAAATPFVERAVRERYRPGEVVDRIGRDMRRGLRTLERMPTMLDRILRRAARGEFRLEIAPRDYEAPLAQITELVNRLAFAIVVAALIIGTTTLLQNVDIPRWVIVIGEVGLAAALAVSFWLFWSIISAHRRARRKG